MFVFCAVAFAAALVGLFTGCMEDGAQGPQGPAGEDGESYVSTTNPVTGEIVTVAITTGDNSPVAININTGQDGSAGNRRPIVEPEPEPEPEPENP
jgi:hypothetical protein